MIPRSAGFGQTATLVQPGEFEAAVSPGFTYQTTTLPNSNSVNGVTVTNGSSSNGGVSLPAAEANAAVGLTDMVALNVHMASGMVQPGAKIALLKGPLSLAILPELAFGLMTQTQGSTVNSNTSSSTTTYLGIMGGFKAIASHEMGIYGGLGYAFQSFGFNGSGLTGGLGGGGGGSLGGSGDSHTAVVSHNINLAVGYELKVGGVRIRPELAFLFSPAVITSSTSGNTTVTQGGGTLIYLFPNVTFAAAASTKTAQ